MYESVSVPFQEWIQVNLYSSVFQKKVKCFKGLFPKKQIRLLDTADGCRQAG